MSLRLHVAEPPARYLVRPAVVIDCSVLAGLVFREHWYDVAQDHLQGRAIHAPHLLMYEITNVALKKHRRGEAHALPGLAAALVPDVELHEVEMAPGFALAQRYQLSAYDASYLWLAEALKCPLVTFDQGLAQAPQRPLRSLG